MILGIKIYVVDQSDLPFGESWQNWSSAVELGAEFYDGNIDGIYNPVDLNGNNLWDNNEDRPDMIGDRIAWCVFNDKDTNSLHTLPKGNHFQGIEIHQTVFGFKSEASSPLNDMIFIRYKIYNSGLKNSVLDSVYFTAWADADLGSDYEDDLIGCSTSLNSGYVYDVKTDTVNQNSAFFINLLQGPQTYIPGITFIDNNSNGIYDENADSPIDTAYNNGGSLLNRAIYPGAKNLNMTSFMLNTRHDFSSMQPDSVRHMRNFMIGLSRQGNPIEPCSFAYGSVFGGVNCNEINHNYMFSGSPVTNSGWIQTTPDDIRFCVNSGPFTLIDNKPVTIIIGYTIGAGENPASAVSNGLEKSEFINKFYNSNFDDNMLAINDKQNILINNFFLSQNYPNPFNPVTNISYAISEKQFVTLKVYDVLGNEITVLVNEEKPAGEYEVTFDASGLSSGIYFYRVAASSNNHHTANFTETKSMILLK